jgi:methyltransferase (TIGR00027 family)
VKAGTPSATALAGAAIRALESLRPPNARWCVDPLAAAFLKPWHRGLLAACAQCQSVRDVVERILEWRYPGVPMDFICRTRWIDERAQRFLSADAQRLLVVGAGYDTRCLRLAIPSAVDCVEVDHPDTQARKRAIAMRVASSRVQSMQWIAQDLSTGFPATLEARHTFTIVEGVSSYLPLDVTVRVLSEIAALSSAGSELIFTYVDSDWLDEAYAGADVAGGAIARALRRNGEPFVSGQTPDQAKTLMRHLGFLVLDDVDETTLALDANTGRARALSSISGFRLLHARRVGINE